MPKCHLCLWIVHSWYPLWFSDVYWSNPRWLKDEEQHKSVMFNVYHCHWRSNFTFDFICFNVYHCHWHSNFTFDFICFSLTEELCRKNVEVERLTSELKKRNSKIGQLNLDLLSTQNKASVVNDENIHGSVTSTYSDGNVYSKSSNQLRNAVSPMRSPTSTTSDVRRLSDMSNLNHCG